MQDVLAVVMAGGKGKRLAPLTDDRSKPAVPFGGTYRIIDVVLSNCINSTIYKIIVLPQYKSQSLVDHLEAGWNIFSYALGHYLKIVSPQMRSGDKWYEGTADSVRQNTYLLSRDPKVQNILILSGDHIYKMDYSLFKKYHDEQNADVTVSVIEVPRSEASSFGVVEVDEDFNIRKFYEKPADPVAIPGDPERSLASMGIYMFRKDLLLDILNNQPGMDFGHDVIPSLLDHLNIKAYPYRARNVLTEYTWHTKPDGHRERVLTQGTADSGYWRDVGTLDSYWNANMDLCGVEPFFNLYGELWPIRTYLRQAPPAKFIFQAERENPPRAGKALDSLVGHGSIISGRVRNSVVGSHVTVRSWTEVNESVIMDDVTVDRYCIINKAIIDKQNYIPRGTQIGVDPHADRERFPVTERGITVVPKEFFKL